jgi:MFS transporter, ACS family, solute carrier family 17 (sodium-dependent inorganic phosphate cotransporter), other
LNYVPAGVASAKIMLGCVTLFGTPALAFRHGNRLGTLQVPRQRAARIGGGARRADAGTTMVENSLEPPRPLAPLVGSAALRRGRRLTPRATPKKYIVPHIPFTGDDQGSTIYTALSTIEGRYDEGHFEADLYAREATGTDSEGEEPAAAAAGRTEVEGTFFAGKHGTPAPCPPAPVAHRWQVVGMMALSFVLCNMDKVNMSVAVIPMAKELGWSPVERGLVSSSFFWGYSLTQIPAGLLATRIGGARVLFAGVLLWSLGTAIAPPAAKFSLLALCATRLFVGLGEGLAPSAATNVMSRLVPENERARAVSAVFGGLDIGSAVGLLLCGPLIHWFGWQSVFYLFAVLGFVWCVAWPFCKPEEQDMDLPPQMFRRRVAPAPSASGAPAAAPRPPVPWGKFLRSKPVWAIIVAHFCYNWGYYTLLAWLPSYFDMALGLNVEKSSLLTLIPYIAMSCMTPFVGPVADGLVSKGWRVTTVRKMSQGIAFAGPAVCMLALAVLTPATAGTGPTGLIVGIMSLAFALGAWARAGLYCNHQDLSPKYAAALLGLSNTAGALPGVLGVTAAGYLLDATGSWAYALFFPTAMCQIFGLVIYSIFASSKRQGWDD